MLVAVPRRTKVDASQLDHSKLDHSKAVAEARQPSAAGDQAADRGKREMDSLIASGLARSAPRGRLGYYASDAARRAIAKTIGGVKVPGVSATPSAGESSAEDNGKKEAQMEPPAEAGKKANGKDQEEKKGEDPAAKNGKVEPANGKNARWCGQVIFVPSKVSEAGPSGPAPSQISRDQLAAELQRAWRLRDELADPNRPQTRPLDYAPHLWREVEQRLLVLDRKLRTGFVLQTDENSRTAPPVGRIARTTCAWRSIRGHSARFTRLADRPMRPGLALARLEPASLAFAELIALEGGPHYLWDSRPSSPDWIR